MIRQFLSATLFAVAERVAPKPKIHPWPFALGAMFTVFGGLWLWVLNEEAGLARIATKTERDITKKRLDAIEADRFELRGRGEVVRARVAGLEEHLRMPKGGETFAAFKARAPRSRSAIGLWNVIADDEVWCATERTWRRPRLRHGRARGEAFADDSGPMDEHDRGDHEEIVGGCRHVCDSGPAAHGQIRRGTWRGAMHVVRVVDDGQPNLFNVRVAMGEILDESRPYRTEFIEQNWPILFNGDALSDAELVRCGLPARVPHSLHADGGVCPTGTCDTARTASDVEHG